MPLQTVRKNLLTKPIYKWARGVLPFMSETEREALDAGEVWWDAELFSGNPDWEQLLETKKPTLSPEEQAFLSGPVRELMAMLDDWEINWSLGDLPEEVWDFLKTNKFFGMIIPEKHGGLGFSAYGHSEIIRTISTRSTSAAVTVMVPNSLGPGELLLQYGTDEQREYWLPRLADGREVPAFGLTSPDAGSDAAAMTDTGIVCKGDWRGEEVIGIRLNWEKRYITLGPVCTVLGLAFKLKDPERLLGGGEDRGITVALVPTDVPGVSIGRRHLASYQMFQNGPNGGEDVFIPIGHIIGGADYAGKGWAMLMGALAAGRGISLPSLSAAAAAFTARTTGSYSRVRQQFGIPIAKFEGVGRRLGFLARRAYVLDAARRLTCAGLDEGRKLAVISSLMKSNATYLMRDSVNDAMDVHAGKAVIDGPGNYLGNIYRAVPVGITVEGANILTRNMIIFGQGAIRCHPHLLDEMMALEESDEKKSLDAFDKAFWAHVGHSFKTLFRAWSRNWTGGRFAPAPDAGKATPFYKQLSRYAAAFGLTSDMALLTLGGALKRKEMLSARLGDVLSELYFLSATLKRWEDEGRQDADFPVLRYSMLEGFAAIERHLDEVLANLPNRFVSGLLRVLILPARKSGAPDELVLEVGALLTAPSDTRERLTENVDRGFGDDAVAQLEQAFDLVIATDDIRDKMKRAGVEDWRRARQAGLITNDEASRMGHLEKAIDAVIAVDDFPPEAFAREPARPSDPAKASDNEAAISQAAE